MPIDVEIEGLGPRGKRGWAPLTRAVTDGHERVVLERYDWVGGELPKPETGYLGPEGIVSDPADATNIRGPQGLSAFQVALLNGFEGTQEQWLESLYGLTAYEVWLLQPGNEGKTIEQYFAFLKGVQGDSAFTVWLAQPGNEGKTIEQYHAFLKGETGDPAPILTSRFDYVHPYSYCGVALSTAAESDPVWKITRIQSAENGSVSSTSVINNVAWADRLTETYA